MTTIVPLQINNKQKHFRGETGLKNNLPLQDKAATPQA
jgi:hypothetical protein